MSKLKIKWYKTILAYHQMKVAKHQYKVAKTTGVLAEALDYSKDPICDQHNAIACAVCFKSKSKKGE